MRYPIVIVVVIFIIFFSWIVQLNAWWKPDGNSICLEGQWHYAERAISDNKNGAILTWNDNNVSVVCNEHAVVRAQRISGDGNTLWGGNGVILCSDTTSYSPDIIADLHGGAIITWCTYLCYGDIGGIFVQRVDSSGNNQWNKNGIIISPADSVFESHSSPEITPDGAGGGIIVWNALLEIWPDEYITEGLAQRIDSNGNIQWSSDCVRLGGEFEDFAVVTDGAGGVIIAFTSYNSDTEYDEIYVQRIRSNGDKLWGSVGDSLGSIISSGPSDCPRVVPDGFCGAMVAWNQDGRNYAQRIDSLGNALWSGPVELSLAEGSHSCPNMILDGSNGIICIWHDSRGGIYAQRLNNSGGYIWHPYGYLVCSTTMAWNGVLATDGYEGAIVAWCDNKTGDYDVYAQRIDSAGSILWGTEGVVICDQDSTQYTGSVVSDNDGGAIVAWSDFRWGAGRGYLYALRVDGSGNIVYTSTPQLNPSIVLRQNYPNPFNPTTVIEFNLPKAAHAKLNVYSVDGEHVVTLVDKHCDAGRKQVIWNAQNKVGRTVSSGIYFYRLVAGDFVQTKKMVLLR